MTRIDTAPRSHSPNAAFGRVRSSQLPSCLEDLDPIQRAAVLDTRGYVCIQACAGAGKSSVLAARIAHLLESGVSPEEILCITFTNSAAEEMRARLYYTAVTRASDCLCVCSSRTRMLAGGMRRLGVSRFVRDAPQDRILV